MTDQQISHHSGVASGDTRAAHTNGIVDKMRSTAAEQLTNQKNRATDGLGTVAQAVRQSTQQLRSEQHDTIARYAEQVADQIERFSQRLRDKDVAELMRDIQQVARRQPALFIGGAFALGLVGARFFKSSSRNERASWRQPAGETTSIPGARSDLRAAETAARRSYEPPQYSASTETRTGTESGLTGEAPVPGETPTPRRSTTGGRPRRTTPTES